MKTMIDEEFDTNYSEPQYPITDASSKKNFRIAIQTCDNCNHCSKSWGQPNYCQTTPNLPKTNYVCDKWEERRV